MCKRLDWEKANNRDKIRRKSQLPPKPCLFDQRSVDEWWDKLTPKQKRSLRLGAK
jgi:hypothetical protein